MRCETAAGLYATSRGVPVNAMGRFGLHARRDGVRRPLVAVSDQQPARAGRFPEKPHSPPIRSRLTIDARRS